MARCFKLQSKQIQQPKTKAGPRISHHGWYGGLFCFGQNEIVTLGAFACFVPHSLLVLVIAFPSLSGYIPDTQLKTVYHLH